MGSNGRQLATSLAIAGTLLLGACTGAPDPTPAPTTSIEQSVDAGPTTSPTVPTPAPEDQQWPAADERGTVPDGLEFAAYAENYEFSDQPQGAGEQWIFDNYPDLWEQGVRAVSSENTLLSYDAMRYEPGPVVQYINGDRYEGTPQMPLGFRGHGEPEKLPTDIIENVKSSLRDPSQTASQTGNTGAGGYAVDILFNPDYKSLPASESVVVQVRESSPQGLSDAATPRTFGSHEEALEWVLNNPVVPNLDREGLRPLNKGEIARITVSREKMDGTRSNREYGVYNPATGQIEWISK